jgi:secondary thiamine-phosphate synthase enzyme
MNIAMSGTTVEPEAPHMPERDPNEGSSNDRGPVTVTTKRILFHTEGDAHIVNITAKVRALLAECGLKAGTATVFVPGATGALTTLEFEPGVVADFQRLFDRLAPEDQRYEHNITHPDANGHAHIRAGLLGPSLVVPFADGAFCLGRWQEICFVCFDNRPRERTVIVQFMGV